MSSCRKKRQRTTARLPNEEVDKGQPRMSGDRGEPAIPIEQVEAARENRLAILTMKRTQRSRWAWRGQDTDGRGGAALTRRWGADLQDEKFDSEQIGRRKAGERTPAIFQSEIKLIGASATPGSIVREERKPNPNWLCIPCYE
jgi:hypothetical protein